MAQSSSLKRLLAIAVVLLSSSSINASVLKKTPTSPDSGPGGTSIPTAAPTAWVHPGVFVSQPQLDFVAEQVAAGAQPWSDAYTAMIQHPLASPTRTASPFATVDCGPTSTPNVGCYEERNDSMAAYANALAWTITNVQSYADKAISYMNAWSSKLKAHTNSNAPLQSAWSAANWVRAGEIMRHASTSWATQDIQAFENMLRNVYLPLIQKGSDGNGNWELVMMEATIGAAVFLEDSALYTSAMSIFAKRVPAYLYLTSDGPYPIPGTGIANTEAAVSSFWYNQKVFNVSGISQETCRDFAHTSYGISSISHVAETARIQGNDLWQTSVGTRVQAALGLHAPYLTGTKIPSWLCGGDITRSFDPIVEPGYNALAYRLNRPMPNTDKLVLEQRPALISQGNALFIGWETLTNAQNNVAPPAPNVAAKY